MLASWSIAALCGTTGAWDELDEDEEDGGCVLRFGGGVDFCSSSSSVEEHEEDEDDEEDIECDSIGLDGDWIEQDGPEAK